MVTRSCVQFLGIRDRLIHWRFFHEELHIPDQIYNWLMDFFDNHSRFTVFRVKMSSLLHSPPVLSRGQL